MSREQLLRVFTQPFGRLYRDEVGALISAEMALVGTLGVLASAVGIESVSTSVNQELNDLGNAFSSLDQSFSVRGLSKGRHASVAGACFSGNSSRFSQLAINDICGNSSLEGGVAGFESISGVESVGVEELEVRTLETCSTTPVAIQETRVPKTTTVTVTITDSDTVTHRVESQSHCTNGRGERVIDERIIDPDVRETDPNALPETERKPTAPTKKAQPTPPKKSEPIPMPKAESLKGSPKSKTTPKPKTDR